MKFSARLTAAAWATIGGFALLFGCKPPDSEAGWDIQSAYDLLDVQQTDTFTVELQSVREVRLESDQLSTAVVGRMWHPLSGWHLGGFVSQFRLSAPDINFGEGVVVDSVRLHLALTGDTYGIQRAQRLEVRALSQPLSLDSTYYTNSFFETSGENLADGSSAILLGPSGAEEVLIPLQTAWGASLLSAGDDAFDTNENWLNFLPGLSIQPAQQGMGEGAVGVDLAGGATKVRIHYHNATDTLFYDLVVNALSARANTFSHQWKGDLSPWQQTEAAELPVGGPLHIMSGAGSKVRVVIPHLDVLGELSGQTVIQKAELWLPVSEASLSLQSRYPIPANLFILSEDADGNPVSTPDQNSAGVNIGGVYDPSVAAYRFNIPQTVQRMLLGSLPSERLHVVAGRAGISLLGVSFEGTQAPTWDTTGTRRSRLVLTYSH
jgi:hypothetical protein